MYHDLDVEVWMCMPHLGHAQAANSVQYGRRKTDRVPPPQRGLRLGVVWYRLLTRLERPRIRRRATDTSVRPVTAAAASQQLVRRPILQVHADIATPTTP